MTLSLAGSGVGVNWPLPSYITEQANYQNTAYLIFSSFHTAVGAIFLGSSSLYISSFKKNNRDISWFKQADRNPQDSLWQRWLTKVMIKIPHYKLVSFSVAWIALGMIWFTRCEDNWHILDSLDYVISSATGAGYKGISNDSPGYQFAFAAIYCAISAPLIAITIGA